MFNADYERLCLLYPDYPKCREYVERIQGEFISNTYRLTRFDVIEYLNTHTTCSLKRAIRVANIMYLENKIQK